MTKPLMWIDNRKHQRALEAHAAYRAERQRNRVLQRRNEILEREKQAAQLAHDVDVKVMARLAAPRSKRPDDPDDAA